MSSVSSVRKIAQHQLIRAVMVSITNDPESDEVMKNMITNRMPMKEEIDASGNWPNMVNSWSSSAASCTPVKPSATT